MFGTALSGGCLRLGWRCSETGKDTGSGRIQLFVKPQSVADTAIPFVRSFPRQRAQILRPCGLCQIRHFECNGDVSSIERQPVRSGLPTTQQQQIPVLPSPSIFFRWNRTLTLFDSSFKHARPITSEGASPLRPNPSRPPRPDRRPGCPGTTPP